METNKRPPRREYTTEKYCRDCNKTKPIDQFSERTGYQKGMHAAFCKQCMKERSESWKARNRERYLQSLKDYQIKKKLKLMKHWFCDSCGKNWSGDDKCPECGETVEIRNTMSPEEAEKAGLK